MDFSALDVRKSKNTRKEGSGFKKSQEFSGIKYQMKNNGTSNFTVSNKLWVDLNLDQNAFMFGRIENDVFLGLVPQDHSSATLFSTQKVLKNKKL